MKLVLFRVDFVIRGADPPPFLRPPFDGCLLLLLVLCLYMAGEGEGEKLGIPTSSKLGLDDAVAGSSLLAGVLAGVLAIARVFSAGFFCDFRPLQLLLFSSFLLFVLLLLPVPVLYLRAKPAMVDKQKTIKKKWWESFDFDEKHARIALTSIFDEMSANL
jgi:hypothetical protein